MERQSVLFLFRKICLLGWVIPTFVSCQISGLTSGYSYLSKQEQANVVKYKGEIASIHDYSKVYTITPEQVKAYLKTHNRVIIYDYTPWCKSEYCINPKLLADRCKAKGVDLLVISNVYDEVFGAVNTDFPMFMIDTDAMKTKWRGKYINRFYQSLTGRTPKDVDYAPYFYFKDGVYVCSFKSINEMNTIMR